jgi:hypothetical protein
MENNRELPQETKNRTAICCSNTILGIYPKDCKSEYNKDLHTDLYCSNDHNSQAIRIVKKEGYIYELRKCVCGEGVVIIRKNETT